jgi:hypothetical protein
VAVIRWRHATAFKQGISRLGRPTDFSVAFLDLILHWFWRSRALPVGLPRVAVHSLKLALRDLAEPVI